MSTPIKKITQPSIFGSNVSIGKIVKIVSNGSAIIKFENNKGGYILARSTVNLNSYELNDTALAYDAVIVFENGDLSLPIIVGIIADPQVNTEVALVSSEQPVLLDFDRKQVVLNAEEEIILRCGKSSISLFKDGKILLRGIKIISRALESNKLKGGTISIN